VLKITVIHFGSFWSQIVSNARPWRVSTYDS